MDREYYLVLAKVRLDRAKELVTEARELLEKDAYKSANNRAFYAIEKGVKALLAIKEVDVMTHNGGLKQFYFQFIYKGDGTFTSEDDQKIAKAEQIRNASDYDDVYLESPNINIKGFEKYRKSTKAKQKPFLFHFCFQK